MSAFDRLRRCQSDVGSGLGSAQVSCVYTVCAIVDQTGFSPRYAATKRDPAMFCSTVGFSSSTEKFGLLMLRSFACVFPRVFVGHRNPGRMYEVSHYLIRMLYEILQYSTNTISLHLLGLVEDRPSLQGQWPHLRNMRSSRRSKTGALPETKMQSVDEESISDTGMRCTRRAGWYSLPRSDASGNAVTHVVTCRLRPDKGRMNNSE